MDVASFLQNVTRLWLRNKEGGLNMELREKLCSLRKENGISQLEIAEKLEVSRNLPVGDGHIRTHHGKPDAPEHALWCAAG